MCPKLEGGASKGILFLAKQRVIYFKTDGRDTRIGVAMQMQILN
jgi:hypothetical protein